MAVGAMAAYVQGLDQKPEHQLLESLGGLIAGWPGGCCPDFLEPAQGSPNHRDVAHSLAAGASLLKLSVSVAEGWRSHWRTLSDEFFAAAAAVPLDSPQRLTLQVQGSLARVIAGMFVGFAAGYFSHLALDAQTPKCLPLLGAATIALKPAFL